MESALLNNRTSKLRGISIRRKFQKIVGPKKSTKKCNDGTKVRASTAFCELKASNNGLSDAQLNSGRKKTDLQTSEARTKKIEDTIITSPPKSTYPERIRLPSGITDIDNERDGIAPAEYARDIINYHAERELTFRLSGDLHGSNSQITPAMRSILVDWLLQVQVHEELDNETLHLAVALLDRVVRQIPIALEKYQLLGVTCLFIASKLEQRFPPEVTQLLHLTEDTYSKEDLLAMERLILKALEFDLWLPGPHSFLHRYLAAAVKTADTDRVEELCEYLSDLSLVDARCTSYLPSQRAAAAVYLSQRLVLSVSAEEAWTPDLCYYSRYDRTSLMPCVRRLAKLLEKSSRSKHRGAYNKYASRGGTGLSQNAAVNQNEVFAEYLPAIDDVTEECLPTTDDVTE